MVKISDNALVAVGFVIPVFLIAVDLGSGLGSGATAAISHFIGKRNQKYIDISAIHTIVLTIIFFIIIAIITFLFLKPILIILGAGNIINMALDYGYIIFGDSFFLIFSSVAYDILRVREWQ
ncbi:MATE family efflux transporter [Methanobrevibacter curvatus]|uniref:MatE n=1 Tax=Methanobrevibacter curvatus TaxID=49547 RepID=A0A162FHJ5_9EURY|nr:MATE family efflux transporter [Methanobrevibacter curvatus]KZX13145.1 MatE [Methanobrevibacter curvatus]